MKILLRLFLWLTISGIPAAIANACTCKGTYTPQRNYSEADAVFSGKVVKVEDVNNEKSARHEVLYRKITLRINETWKGDADHDFTLISLIENCDFFANGESSYMGIELLIYADEVEKWYGEDMHPQFPFWVASICSRSSLLKNARKDLKYLRRNKQRQ